MRLKAFGTCLVLLLCLMGVATSLPVSAAQSHTVDPTKLDPTLLVPATSTFPAGAVIDHQFNTTDVFIIVKTELVTEKYIRHYERGMREQDG